MNQDKLRFLPIVGRKCPGCGGFMAMEADGELVCLLCGLRPLPADFRPLPHLMEITTGTIRV